MKKLLIITCFVISDIIGFGQTVATEAKAAYLLAEEAFNANDWTAAINYLEECKKKLGKPNSKVLYLEIMAEMELAKTNASYYDAVWKSIAAFEEASDSKDFNEEKSLEVMKIKLKLKGLQENQKANEKVMLEAPIAARFVDSVFSSFSIRPGQSESIFNRGQLKKFDDQKGTVFYFSSKKKVGPTMVYLKNGVINSVVYLVKIGDEDSTVNNAFDDLVKSFPLQLSKDYVLHATSSGINSYSVVSGKKVVTATCILSTQEISVQIADISYMQ